MLERFLYRAGIAAHTPEGVSTVHELQNIYPETPMSPLRVSWVLLDRLDLLSVVGLLALILILFLSLRRTKGAIENSSWLVLLPLLAMFGISHIVLLQHSYIHEFAFLLGVMPVALATGFVTGHLQEVLRSDTGTISTALVRAVAVAVSICLVVLRLTVDLKKFEKYQPDRDGVIALGHMLRQNVPEGGLVLVPWRTMVPNYYSRRHIVRGIANLDMYRVHADAIHQLCADCPYYAVLRKRENRVGPRFPVVWQDRNYWLVMLEN